MLLFSVYLASCHSMLVRGELTCVCVFVCSPSGEPIYGFSKFICSFNEPEEGVAPTDCRNRPDVRVMEQQDFDTANAEKVIGHQQMVDRKNYQNTVL